ncbi:MAG: glycoside hydrolase family 38 C-terminal domain-containing protein [Phycisphaerae bacterium]
MDRKNVFYVLSTHWDREWYQSFQDFRYRLIKVFDKIMDGLGSGDLKGPFQMDGQAILLEDYLEIRPERRQEIVDYLRTGKLVAGPWYVQPDEFLVSGEALVRNLQLGRKIVRGLGGKPSDAGFVCDIFGHNSQLPQILDGFGIKVAFLWRGINLLDKRIVKWRGADGTDVLAYVFGKSGYSDFAFKVRRCWAKDDQRGRGKILEDFREYIHEEEKLHPNLPILAFDGGDHQGWDTCIYKILTEEMDKEQTPYKIVHESLDSYLNELLPHRDSIDMLLEGELREPAFYPSDLNKQWLIPGVLSSRVWIKQMNAECQTLLCQWVEPFCTFAALTLGCEYPKGFVDSAWKWLIQNHPHDSICGCGIDQIHEDMKYRFSQTRSIADRLMTEASKWLAASIEGSIGDDEARVVVFNPLTLPIDQTIEMTLQIPTSWPSFNEFFGFEGKPAFKLYDDHGKEIPYQRISQRNNRIKVRIHETKFPESFRTHDVTVALPVKIPPMGYITITIKAGERLELEGDEITKSPTRYAEVPSLVTSERSMANKFLDVTIETNGSVTLTDKRTKQIYSRLLTFEDVADIGDGWYHGVAVNDRACVSTACRSEVALVHNGPYLCTFQCRTPFSVPDEFCFDTMVRSERRVELIIDTLLSLRPDCPYLEVTTTIVNPAKDHRLRVLFPSGSKAQTYLADSPFDVVERSIALRADNHLYRELEVETKPQQSWTAVFDGQRGLAIISTGLNESAVCDLPERPIALTLLRATRRTVFTDGEPNGQNQGQWKFRYWIVPLSEKPHPSILTNLGLQLAAGIKTVQLFPEDLAIYQPKVALPRQQCFLQVEGDAVVSCVRQEDSRLEIRMFNPTQKKITTTVHVSPLMKFSRVLSVNFENQSRVEPIPIKNGSFTIILSPKQIITLHLT